MDTELVVKPTVLTFDSVELTGNPSRVPANLTFNLTAAVVGAALSSPPPSSPPNLCLTVKLYHLLTKHLSYLTSNYQGTQARKDVSGVSMILHDEDISVHELEYCFIFTRSMWSQIYIFTWSKCGILVNQSILKVKLPGEWGGQT